VPTSIQYTNCTCYYAKQVHMIYQITLIPIKFMIFPVARISHKNVKDEQHEEEKKSNKKK